MKHKHHELIKLWADGAEIQLQCTNGNWVDATPDWTEDLEYRVKPVNKPFNHVDNMEPYYTVNAAGDVIEIIYTNHRNDYNKLSVANYYHTEEAAQKAADHWKKSNWFVHKALEFQGSCCERVTRVAYAKVDKVWCTGHPYRISPIDILMSKSRADDFIEWLEEFAPDGELL